MIRTKIVYIVYVHISIIVRSRVWNYVYKYLNTLTNLSPGKSAWRENFRDSEHELRKTLKTPLLLEL
jgi:hypothetical protein